MNFSWQNPFFSLTGPQPQIAQELGDISADEILSCDGEGDNATWVKSEVLRA
jgi:hypothetical protein